MASVFSRKGVWYLRVKDASGRWVKVRSSAKTKTEAKRLADELERKYERQRLGLEALTPRDGGGTLAELLNWWLVTFSARLAAHQTNESSVRTHLLSSGLAALKLTMVTAPKIEEFLLAKEVGEELEPQTLNHLIGFISRAFNAARKMGRYSGQNPVKDVKRRKVFKRIPDYLRLEEVVPVISALDARWRPLFFTAVYTALRKGELLNLKKSSVDLKRRLLLVGDSWHRDVTKGGHEDVIPIAAECVPWLEQAMDASPSELVFPAPGPNGKRMRKDKKLEDVLRRALGRAGIVTGYNQVCRARGCGHTELSPDNALRRCQKDGRSLWPKPLVRPIRFHDLRHTTPSLLVSLGVHIAVVQQIMRHSDPKMTNIYTHLSPEFLRDSVDRLSFGVSPQTFQQAQPVAKVANGFVPVVSPGEDPDKMAGEPDGKTSMSPASLNARDTGFEPVAFGSGGRADVSPAVHNASQTMPVSRGSAGLRPGPQSNGPILAGPFADLLSPLCPRPLRALEGGAEHLLTVREVAARLGVCPATVYKLCNSGQLRHARVSNAIRVRPADLREYIARAGGGAH